MNVACGSENSVGSQVTTARISSPFPFLFYFLPLLAGGQSEPLLVNFSFFQRKLKAWKQKFYSFSESHSHKIIN